MFASIGLALATRARRVSFTGSRVGLELTNYRLLNKLLIPPQVALLLVPNSMLVGTPPNMLFSIPTSCEWTV